LLLRWGISSAIVAGATGAPPVAGSPGRGPGRKCRLRVVHRSGLRRFQRWIASRGIHPGGGLQSAVDVRSTERVTSVGRAGRATVYDIEVPGPTRFVANGIISHNTAKSQLLRYVSQVAPRGIYTSGKGSTAAGLTAAAVKDDFAGGRWMLEAGMLVLADGGMAVIDELDKMSPEDRSAMHEALEQQTVSIAKAGITSTLNARCPVLAAANPKLGRFTNERPISEQIDLPPTLLSRFDVIFSIRDLPNQDRDRTLAGRILASHRDVELLGPGAPEGEAPPFSPEFLKKYVAYARTVRPRLSDEALAVLQDYYVRVRRQGEEPDAPVPITARQLEALVRLSEAAARARLGSIVRPEDAQRAVRIMGNYLRRVAMTPEGRIDIDITQTGVSHSQREQFELARSTMRELQGAPGGQFSLAEYLEAMARHGVAEGRAEGILQTLRNQGEVFEQRTDRFQLTRF